MCGNGFGTIETYNSQVSIPIRGKVYGIDKYIHKIISALLAGGVETTASCCGHNEVIGRIDLADGRVLGIFKDSKQWEIAAKCTKSYFR